MDYNFYELKLKDASANEKVELSSLCEFVFMHWREQLIYQIQGRMEMEVFVDSTGREVFHGFPMSGQEFDYRRRGQLQYLELNDRNELAETARHYRTMERDTHKSILKQQEYDNKQRWKLKTAEILESEQGVSVLIYNGKGEIISKELLLGCKIKQLFRFRRKFTEESCWQILIKKGEQETLSSLYPAGYLQSISRLKTTVLGIYDNSSFSGHREELWSWLRQKLLILYEGAEEVELPSLAGWFLTDGNWHFWVNSEETALLAGNIISQFTRGMFDKTSVGEVADDFLEITGWVENSVSLSILLIFRLLALTSRLATDSLPPMGLTLIGKYSAGLAKALLSTMHCEAGLDFINLDSDRIGLIRKNVGKLQDTPVILISINSGCKSTQNRLREVMSWLDSGLMEGKQITFPFVFCLQNFSPVYPLDNTIVLATDEIQIPEGFKVFDELQAFIIQQIENGGTYWAEEFRSQYEKLRGILPDEEVNTVLHISRAVASTVLKMLDLGGREAGKHSEVFRCRTG